MKEYLISLFIDNELDMDEKITFVETVHDNRPFTDEALSLLRQEKRLRAELTVPVMVPAMPPLPEIVPSRSDFFTFWFRPLAGFAAAMLLVGLFSLLQPKPVLSPQEEQHRFVVYLPESNQARIVGTFTGWKPISMERVGTSGYWTLTLPVPKGEHRYSYLVEDGRQIADPTVVAREQDDFGGENSVIEVQVAV
ncbi:glycogen-binding domain-containing protein [uncultured Desulfobulbus sp.]|uniref:glycogen-binding domain-containing protein n=1 Tax=uncultured Desulfobulbus sp. TaxID=239745 RepID=UPI0029C63FF4|nr:glycogen-binding domain-containing protein [uncultured Desulfobulbus sp.]